MKQNLDKLSKNDLIILTTNYYATLKKVSKLYLKSKIDNEYLKRRNEIVENRLSRLKLMWEKKNNCTLKFNNIDYEIRKERKSRKKTDKNDNAKI